MELEAVAGGPRGVPPPLHRPESAEILGDDGVVADEEERASEKADDGDDEGGEGYSAGAVVREFNRRRRREDDVAPLRAVDTAEAQGAVPRGHVRHPRLLAIAGGGHEPESHRSSSALRLQQNSTHRVGKKVYKKKLLSLGKLRATIKLFVVDLEECRNQIGLVAKQSRKEEVDERLYLHLHLSLLCQYSW